MQKLLILVALCALSVATNAQKANFQFSPSFALGTATYSGTAVSQTTIFNGGLRLRFGGNTHKWQMGVGLELYNSSGSVLRTDTWGGWTSSYYETINRVYVSPHGYFGYKMYLKDKLDSYVYAGGVVGGAFNPDVLFFGSQASGYTGADIAWLWPVSKTVTVEISEGFRYLNDRGTPDWRMGDGRQTLNTYMFMTHLGIRLNK